MSIVLNGNFDADLKLIQHFDCNCSDDEEPIPCPPIMPICPPITPICPPVIPICPIYTPIQPIEPFCPPTAPIKSIYEPPAHKIVEICPFCVEVEN
jgi:hypothetical protein